MVAKGLTLATMLEEAGIEGRTWRRVVNSGQAMSTAFSKGLKKALGYSESEMEELLLGDDIPDRHLAVGGMQNARKSYETLSLVQLMRRHENWESIWDQILPVYEEWEIPDPDGEGNDFGTSEKWTDVARASPDTHFVMLEDEKHIVGFWAFAPVLSTVYETILSGANINKDFSAADIDYPFFEGDYDIYFIDLFYTLERGLTPLVFLRHVLEGIQEVLENWAENQIFIRRIAAHLSTFPAIKLCEEDLGFTHVVDHETHTMFGRDGITPIATKVLELTSVDLVKNPRAMNALFSGAPHVAARYQKRFGSDRQL